MPVETLKSPRVNGDLLGSTHRPSETFTDSLGPLRSTKSLLETGLVPSGCLCPHRGLNRQFKSPRMH